MKQEIIYSIFNDRSSENISLLFFGIESEKEESLIEYAKNGYHKLSDNHLTNFMSITYNISKYVLPKYSNKYSKHTYTLPQLMGMLAHKLRLKMTYQETVDDFRSSVEKRKALHLKTVPSASTLQRFMEKFKTGWLRQINNLMLSLFNLKPKIIAMDGTGYTSEQGDLYYRGRTGKKRIAYTKNHISIDTETQLILHWQVQEGPKHDSPMAIPHLKFLHKEYEEIEHVALDKGYDAEKNRVYVMEDMEAVPHIPTKKNPRTGKYRQNNYVLFHQKIYNQRNKVETVNSVQKRIFGGKNTSRKKVLRNKETAFKNMLYAIYRTLRIIEESQKKPREKRQTRTDETRQTKIEDNIEMQPIYEIINGKYQEVLI